MPEPVPSRSVEPPAAGAVDDPPPPAGWRGRWHRLRGVWRRAVGGPSGRADPGERAALALSVDNLTLTLNATGDGIFASDALRADQPLLFVNRRLLEIFDIPPASAAALTPAGVIAAAHRFFVDPEREIARIQAIIRGNQAAEDRLALNDGRVLTRRCTSTVAGGRPVRVWVFRDVTVEARALEAVRAAEARHRALLDAFPGFIACVDGGLRFSYVNERLAAAMGRPAAEIVGQRADVRPDFPDHGRRFAEDLRRALAGEVLEVERELPVQGRAPIDLLVTMARGASAGGGADVAYVFGTDISALKATEAALVEARDAAEAANRAKSAFLSSMSHELRTPMNAVLGFAHLLQSQGGLTPRQHGHVAEIRRGGQHLLTLINDLLDLARIEAGRLAVHVQALALRPLAVESLALVLPAALARGIRIALPPEDDDIVVLADHTRLKQVLVNLLGNAVKYNRDGGWVRVDWWSATGADGGPDAGRAMLAVIDGGPGMDAAQQQRLFQPFERLDAERSGVEGTGIGLALSRRLVELMGGEIGVHSTPGEGSRFTVGLPLAPATPTADGPGTPVAVAAAARLEPAAPQAHRPPGPLVPSVPHRVLYVEDNAVNALLMAGLLEALPGLQLHLAETPEAGLAQAAALQPALVLLDIQLPGIDGYELLRRMRRLAGLATVPVVAVSASAGPHDMARARAAGFAGYLAKPLDPALLLSTVAHLLGLPEPVADARR